MSKSDGERKRGKESGRKGGRRVGREERKGRERRMRGKIEIDKYKD